VVCHAPGGYRRQSVPVPQGTLKVLARFGAMRVSQAANVPAVLIAPVVLRVARGKVPAARSRWLVGGLMVRAAGGYTQQAQTVGVDLSFIFPLETGHSLLIDR
jgi:hypothetical protein